MLKRLCILFSILLLTVGAKAQDEADIATACDTIPTWHEALKQTNWMRVISTFAFRTALKIAVVNTLKDNVHEWRPDGSDDHSFPSRHATWAFGIGGKVTYTLGRYSPWWAIASQIAADGVGMQRVVTRRHYPHDVLAGAAIGVGTDLLAKMIGNWIFGNEDNFPGWRHCVYSNSAALYVSTAAAFPLKSQWGQYSLEMGLASAVRAVLPTSQHWAAYVQGEMSSYTLKENGHCLYPLNSLSMAAGMMYSQGIADTPLAVGARLGVGYRFNLNNKSVDVCQGSLQLQGAVECSVNVTRNLAFAIDGYCQCDRLRIATERSMLGTLGVSFLTRANF